MSPGKNRLKGIPFPVDGGKQGYHGRTDLFVHSTILFDGKIGSVY